MLQIQVAEALQHLLLVIQMTQTFFQPFTPISIQALVKMCHCWVFLTSLNDETILDLQSLQP